MNAGIAALIVACIAPLLTYLAAARRLSGRIKDSEASDLWAESKAIRDWSTQRVRELHDEIEHLENRVNALDQKNFKLGEENRRLTREVYNLRSRIQHLQDEKASVARLLARAQADLNQLTGETDDQTH